MFTNKYYIIILKSKKKCKIGVSHALHQNNVESKSIGFY